MINEKTDELILTLNKLYSRRTAIMSEICQIDREIEDATTDIFKLNSGYSDLLWSYKEGNSIVKSFDRYWWVDANGELLCNATETEISMLKSLIKKGVIKKISL